MEVSSFYLAGDSKPTHASLFRLYVVVEFEQRRVENLQGLSKPRRDLLCATLGVPPIEQEPRAVPRGTVSRMK